MGQFACRRCQADAVPAAHQQRPVARPPGPPGRRRRRQPFRPSVALKVIAAGVFLTVGSLSTTAAATAATTSTTSTQSPRGHNHDEPGPGNDDHLDDVDDNRLRGHDHDEAGRGVDHHEESVGRRRSHHHNSSGARGPSRRSHHHRACRRCAQRQYDDGRCSPQWGGLYRDCSGHTRGLSDVHDERRYLHHLGADRPAVGCHRNHSAPRLLPEPEPRLRNQRGGQHLPVHVPHTNVDRHHDPRRARRPNGTFTSQTIPPATRPDVQRSAGDIAQRPSGLARCGLNIALVLDQSGSMAGTKQTTLKSAANDTITALTGTPSTVAIYTFASTTGVSIAKTSTINAASAQPLHNFINTLPTPRTAPTGTKASPRSPSGYDEVIFLTDGAPTGSRIPRQLPQASLPIPSRGSSRPTAIKAGGTRIVGVGIGLNGGADNLRAVSGATRTRTTFSVPILASGTSSSSWLPAPATTSSRSPSRSRIPPGP